jgi:hypothetical protein
MFGRAVALVASLLLTATLAPLAAAQPDIQEGEWEITTRIEMPGLPFALPPMKSSTCLTKESMVPPPEKKGQECTMKEMQSKGNEVAWKMECKESTSTMHGSGRIIYTNDSFSGTIELNMQDAGGKTQPMNQQLNGRHVGPCK